MKNRFVRRGLVLLLSGIALNIAGFVMKHHNMGYYGWFMAIGVICFGIRFISLLYSLMRKVEAQGLIEERAEEKEKKKKFKKEAIKASQPSPV